MRGRRTEGGEAQGRPMAAGVRVRVETPDGRTVIRTIRRKVQVGALPPLKSGYMPAGGTAEDPYANLRRHEPRPGEMEAFGLRTVDDMVAVLNARLARRGKEPLCRGEFPTSRDRYERLRRLMTSLPDVFP